MTKMKTFSNIQIIMCIVTCITDLVNVIIHLGQIIINFNINNKKRSCFYENNTNRKNNRSHL